MSLEWCKIAESLTETSRYAARSVFNVPEMECFGDALLIRLAEIPATHSPFYAVVQKEITTRFRFFFV